MKRLRVTIENKSYDVLVEVLDEASGSGILPAAAVPPGAAPPPSPRPIEEVIQAVPHQAGPAVHSNGAAVKGEVASPLSGKVVSIDVVVGQTIVEGTQVATVEAMKMNTYIYAPTNGRVSAILVNRGDGVQEGGVLLRLT